jgi:hypothetical protein
MAQRDLDGIVSCLLFMYQNRVSYSILVSIIILYILRLRRWEKKLNHHHHYRPFNLRSPHNSPAAVRLNSHSLISLYVYARFKVKCSFFLLESALMDKDTRIRSPTFPSNVQQININSLIMIPHTSRFLVP